MIKHLETAWSRLLEQSFVVIFATGLAITLGYLHYETDKLAYTRIDKLEQEIKEMRQVKYECQEEVARLSRSLESLSKEYLKENSRTKR